jgi:carbamate kinase
MADGEKRAVIALGGNAILSGDEGTAEEQREVVEETARTVSDAVRASYEVVVTHGNGPQVGALMLQQEGAPDTPQMPLDVLVAETQAQIGYVLQQALRNATDTSSATVVTQVVVDDDDPAFENPTKPVGPWYTAEEARKKPFETHEVKGGNEARPYRRVVPSPEPHAVVEADEIEHLVEKGVLVVCAGGGGVPVVRDDSGDMRGVETVVDKDRTSRLVAEHVGADLLVFLTDVEHAYLDYGGEDERPLRSVDTDELRAHLDADEFGEGTMRPKVEAALGFVESNDGVEAVITTPERFEDALDGDSGTRLRR